MGDGILSFAFHLCPTTSGIVNKMAEQSIYKNKLRSSVTTEGRRMAGARALWVANGMKREMMGKPVIAIVNSFTQFVPGHTHLHEIGQYVKSEIEKDENLKKQYYNAIFYKEVECETKSVKQTLIVTFSFKYQEYQHQLKLHQLERARKLVDETNKKNKSIKNKKDMEKIKISKNQNDPKRFIKEVNTTNSGEVACNIKYLIDEEIYKNEEKYNGLYGITTNLIDDTKTIIKVMNGRWEIEESFRIMKDDFDSGTVHLSREDRIKGHFITCYLALFIYRYLEHQLKDKYTVHEIVSKLQEMKMLEHKGKGFEPIQTRNDLTDDLHQFLGINTDTEIITYKKIKKILEEQEK